MYAALPQIFLQCRSSGSQLLSEVIVEKGLSVGECCGVMSLALGLTGDCWHLRKTNWCGEEADVLEDEVSCYLLGVVIGRQ